MGTTESASLPFFYMPCVFLFKDYRYKETYPCVGHYVYYEMQLNMFHRSHVYNTCVNPAYIYTVITHHEFTDGVAVATFNMSVDYFLDNTTKIANSSFINMTNIRIIVYISYE